MLYIRSFHTLIQLFLTTKKKVYFQYHCQQQQFQKHIVFMVLTFLYTGQTMLFTFKYSIATEMWKYDLYMMHGENNWVCCKLWVTQLVGQHIYTCCSFVFDFLNDIRYKTVAFIKSASTTYYLLLDLSCWGVQQNTSLFSTAR
jgi:hypothetical protein